jgi:hypothetical protein
MLVKEISTLEEMLAQLPLVQQLYPDMTKEKYEGDAARYDSE